MIARSLAQNFIRVNEMRVFSNILNKYTRIWFGGT